MDHPLSDAPGARLRQALAEGDPVALDSLRDRAFRGIALPAPAPLRPFVWQKFRKTFYSDGAGVRGFNEAIYDDGLDRPWTAKIRAGRPIRYWPFRVHHLRGQTRIDYAFDNPDPMARIHDPLVMAGDAILGVSKFRVFGRDLLTPTWFLLYPSCPEDS